MYYKRDPDGRQPPGYEIQLAGGSSWRKRLPGWRILAVGGDRRGRALSREGAAKDWRAVKDEGGDFRRRRSRSRKYYPLDSRSSPEHGGEWLSAEIR